MHYWGDDWPHWSDLYRAITVVEKVWRRGRISTIFNKEKYGTYRDHSHFWTGTVHGFIYPDRCYISKAWRWWYYNVDLGVTDRLTKWTGLQWLVHKVQAKFYNYGIQKACRLYPNVVDELCQDLARPELVRGEVDGMSIYRKYWEV